MIDDVAQLAPRIELAMAGERHRLRRRLRAIEQARSAGRAVDENFNKLRRDLEASVRRRQERAEQLPGVELEPDLPITARADEIADAVRQHQVVVVAGETGSGKSTQLPKLLLKMGRGVDGLIGHTQPRRLAARSVAQRVADELASPLGQHVGYKVRFTDKTNPKTYIKLMTDGVLLAEAARDRYFDAYDTLIIDEAHERSLNIDFLLGHLRQILPKRPDLRVIITSATIDTARFAEHFGTTDRTGNHPAPIIEVSGRTYPVEVRYQPIEPDELGEVDDVSEAVARAITSLDDDAGHAGGDVLVFLPTERDIRDCCDLLARRQPGSDILPLYARLTNEEQQAIFAQHTRRKIVVATNVAESSLTVPGIRYVVDTGSARISRYSPNSKVQRLPIEAVSRASCDQRKGRCGRVGPGVCVRLYSEEDFLGREEFTTPEILRTSLASVILQVSMLRFGAIEDFPFIDPPRPSMIRDGYKSLYELGALDEANNVTALGRQLSQMPVDPRVARMVLAAADEGVLDEVLVIASALEMQDPRERPPDQQQKADQAHAQFADERSDFVAYLKLWSFYHTQRDKLSNNQLRKACKQNYINALRMREWVDVHQQLSRMVKELQVDRSLSLEAEGRGEGEASRRQSASAKRQGARTPNPHPSPLRGRERERADLSSQAIDDTKLDAIHRALLTGLLSNIACRGDGFEYNGAGGQKLSLWPGSALFESKPRWVVAAELVETTRRYARTLGKIQPAMIEPIAGHLVKKTYSDERWVAQTGSAMCSEKVSLYGLVLVPARPVPLARVNPTQARQMFIQNALVLSDWPCDLPFYRHNQALIEEVSSLQDKSRRHGLIVGDEARYTFYDQRLPQDIVDAATFKKWYQQASRKEPKLLCMDRQTLLAAPADDVTPRAYPDRLRIEQSEFKLHYTFEPGNAHDGLTLSLPRTALGQLDPRRLGWLVPGMLEQKLTALIKSLPKALRKTLSPAPDAARNAIKHLTFGDGSFEDAAAQALTQVSGLTITASDFDHAQLPEHLKMNVRVLGEQGQTLAEGRDIAAVRRAVGAGALPSYAGMDEARWSAAPSKDWSFGELPRHVETSRSGVALRAYPALVDEQAGVALRLVDTRAKAGRLTRDGLRRLFTFDVLRELRYRADNFPNISRLRLCFAPMGDGSQLRDQLMLLLADRAFLFDGYRIADREAFITRQRAGVQRLDEAQREVQRVIGPVLEGAHMARLSLDQCPLPESHYAAKDVRIQLDNLLGPRFLLEAPWDRLASYPRYFTAIQRRLEKLSRGDEARDVQAFKEIAPHWNRFARQARALRDQGGYDPELILYRWMIEELRVSLFAQELGTADKVSPQRLDRQWEKVSAVATTDA